MGQRSQIYLRYNGKLIFANYYQWNYGERMISRARYGIEWVKEMVDNGWDFVFRDKSKIEQMRRVFDVNFDMHDVAISCDIVQEWKEQFSDEDFNEIVFDEQDNNDGQLFVDIKDGEIYYCFRDMYKNTIMDAHCYMNWDAEGWEEREYLSQEDKNTCRENMKAIEEMATLMTMDQLDDFIHGDYSEIWSAFKKEKEEE